MVDQYRAIVIRTAVDDAMADGERTHLQFLPQPGACVSIRAAGTSGTALDRIGPVRRAVAVRRPRARSRGRLPIPSTCPLDPPPQPAVAVDGGTPGT